LKKQYNRRINKLREDLDAEREGKDKVDAKVRTDDGRAADGIGERASVVMSGSNDATGYVSRVF
jgi:hypothetical protein